MNHFAKFYYIYNSTSLRIARIFAFLFLLIPTIFAALTHVFPNFFIIPLSLFLIFEVYFTQRIAKLIPKLVVAKNNGDPLDSFSLEALGLFKSQKSSGKIVKQMLLLPQVQFLIYKCDANLSDIKITEIDKNSLAQEALIVAKNLSAKYVTTLDLFAAYLLLTEPASQFLFNHKLKEADLENILIWASTAYGSEEMPKSSTVNFAGEGIAEDWVYGWTLETQKYMIDLSKEFLKNYRQPLGRQNEYGQIIESLHKGASVILVGDSGSGKESTVRELAVECFMGRLKGNLYHQKIFQLMVDEFMAGAQNQGELEERLNNLMQELSHSGNVIVYIPEFQNIMGSQSFHLDISGAILPYIKNGNIRIIAAVNPGAYKTFIEPMHSLIDSFTVINFSIPTKEEILNMLFVKSFEIEAKNNVDISYKALVASVNYGQNYSKDKVMPGAAVTLLEDCANAVSISKKEIVEERDIYNQIKKVVSVDVGEPRVEEKNLLLNFEQELHKEIIGQDEAVAAISDSIRRVRAGLESAKRPISFLFLGPTGVGKTHTAKTLAKLYFGNSSRLIRLDMSEYIGDEGMKKLLGSQESEDKGILTEAVFDNPYSLILLDEFEKADKKILDLFLSVFDDGRLTDAKGKTVNFSNSIIIATSNAASEYIRENIGSLGNKKFKQTLLEFLQTKNVFKPELLNRFDDIVVFKPLDKPQIEQIIKLMLVDFTKTLYEKDIRVSFDPKVLEKIATEGFDKEFGARPLRRFIQDNIEDIIARKMLTDEIKRGQNILISTDNNRNIIIT